MFAGFFNAWVHWLTGKDMKLKDNETKWLKA